jgi:simple sugar transport system ATP-binding protein
MAIAAPAALELLDIRKTFDDIVALDGVTLRLAPGSVHGVLGENGAGKSTLMNVAYGLLRPDTGEIRVAGQSVRPPRSPADAIARGVGMVHQHFMLAPPMTVLDNVLLGDRRAPQLLDRGTSADALSAMAQRLGLPIDPHARVESLSVGQQQRVEILKALWRDARVLILDEPTAVLTPIEVDQLFAAVERLRDEGRSVVFISHKLGEVQRICDDLTVLRRGRVVWEGRADAVAPDDLARQMIGHDLAPVTRASTPAPARTSSSPTLVVDRVCVPGLHDVSLHIAPGEILGIAGVDGNGQQELAEAIVGLRKTTAGTVTLSGLDVTRLSLKDRLALGAAHIPNDRKRESLVPTMSVTENLCLKLHDRRPFARAGVMSWRSATSLARSLAQKFDIRAATVDVPVATLSGGNQQKVVLARELGMTDPKLVVAMNPVRGLDVAATNFVYEQLLARRAAGAAILLISSELDELLALCDRIAVLYSGRLTHTNFPDTDRQTIGRLMAGVPA